LRPEEYANIKLINFLENFNESIEGIHKSRINLRSYYIILSSTKILNNRIKCIKNSKKILKNLGIIRNYDLFKCFELNRNYELEKIYKKIDKMKNCFIPKIYGSDLLITNNIKINLENIIKSDDFHEIRKLARNERFLLESLNIYSYNLKKISNEMGKIHDNFMKNMICYNIKNDFPEDLKNNYKNKIINEMNKIIKENEFIN